MAKGLFVVLEGIDGAGKSSQVQPLAHHLEHIYRRPVLLASDSKQGEWGARARAWAHGELELDQEQVVEAFVRDRAQLSVPIAHALRQGHTVVSDRWEHSTWAYHLAAGVSSVQLRHWVRQFPPLAVPDVVLWLDVPVDVALERIDRQRLERLRPELRQRYETPAFLRAVAARYAAMAELHRVDASLPPLEVTRHLLHAILLALDHSAPPRALMQALPR